MAASILKCKYPVKKIHPEGYEYEHRCGSCLHCKVANAQDWQLRLQLEAADHLVAPIFVTMTYTEETLPRTRKGDPTTRASDVTDFIRKLRKNIGYKIRYYGVTDYGGRTGRPHCHVLVFGMPFASYRPDKDVSVPEEHRKRLKEKNVDVDRLVGIELEMLKAWRWKGAVTVAEAGPHRIAYTTKYIMHYLLNKKAMPIGVEKPKARMSRMPGIGAKSMETLVSRLKSHRLVPEGIGLEPLSDSDPKEIAVSRFQLRLGSKYGKENEFGGMEKSKQVKKGMPLPKYLKGKINEHCGVGNLDPYDKDRMTYQRLTVGDGDYDPEKMEKVDRIREQKLKRWIDRQKAEGL